MVLLVTGTSSFDAASWDDDNDGGDDDDDEVVGAVSSCAGLAASCRTWAAMSACLSLSNLKLPVLGTKTCSQKRLKGRGEIGGIKGGISRRVTEQSSGRNDIDIDTHMSCGLRKPGSVCLFQRHKDWVVKQVLIIVCVHDPATASAKLLLLPSCSTTLLVSQQHRECEQGSRGRSRERSRERSR